jgi:DNA mismatch endonuclease, patch repair protein
MADVFSKEKRSEVMSRIRATNTKPELIVRKFLFSKGLRFRLHQKKLPGNPDIVLKKYNTVIFIHGCFWHGHTSSKCKIKRMPKSNISFWENKILTNQNRDKKNHRILKRDGWRIITIWECDLRSKNKDLVLEKLVNKISLKQ